MRHEQGFGGVLKTLRKQKGLTQAVLAAKAGIGQPYLAMIESGERKNPSIDVLQELAKALGVTVGKLLG